MTTSIILPSGSTGHGINRPNGVYSLGGGMRWPLFLQASPDSLPVITLRDDAAPYSAMVPTYAGAKVANFMRDCLQPAGSTLVGVGVGQHANLTDFGVFSVPYSLSGVGPGIMDYDVMTYSPSTHAWSTKAQYNIDTHLMFSTAQANAEDVSVAWSTGISKWVVGVMSSSAGTPAGNDGKSYLVLVPRTPSGTGNLTGVVVSAIPNLVSSGTYGAVTMIRVIMTGASTGLVIANSHVTGQTGPFVTVTPFTLTATTVTWGAQEIAVAGVFFNDAILGDGTNLDILYGVAGPPASFAHIHRSGAGSYTAPQTVALISQASSYGAGNAWNAWFIRDAATNNLYVFFYTYMNSANGEIAYAVRSAGQWWPQAYTVVGDQAGTSLRGLQVLPAVLNGNMYEAHLTYDGANWSLVQGIWPVGGIPNPPQLLSPSGSVTTLTPTISWIYSHPIASDTQYSYEYRVMNGATQIYDSGVVVSAASSVNYGGPALSYGTTYTVQVRVQDKNTQNTSPWSTAASFTPVQGPSVVINSVASAGGATVSSSPATITARVLTVQLTPTVTGAHAMSAYRLDVFDQSGTSLIASTDWVAASFPSGSAYTAAPFDIGPIPNATPLQLVVSVQDAVTSATASATWVLNTSYTLPSAPTGLAVTVNTDEARLELTWTNPGTPFANRAYLSTDGGSTWTQQSPADDVLCTGCRMYSVPLVTNVLVGVTTVASSGVESAMTVSGTLSLDLRQQRMGVTLHAVDSPALLRCFLGLVEDWSSGTGWSLDTGQVTRYVPAQGTKAIESWSRTKQLTTGAGGRKFFVPGPSNRMSGFQLGEDVIAALLEMAGNHHTVLYRDIKGTRRVLYVSVTAFYEEEGSGRHNVVAFGLDERRYLVADGGSGGPVIEILGLDY